MCIKTDSGTNKQVNYKSFKIHVILKSYTCGSKSITKVTFLSQAFSTSRIPLVHTLSLHSCKYRHTPEMLRVRFQTTATKWAVVFLLLEGLAFNMLKTQHLWSAIKLGMAVQSSLWHTAGHIVNDWKKKGRPTAHFHYYCTIESQVFLFSGAKLNLRMYVQYDNSLS